MKQNPIYPDTCHVDPWHVACADDVTKITFCVS